MNKEQLTTIESLEGTYRTVNIFEGDWIVLGLENPSRNYLYHACGDLERSIISVNTTTRCSHCGIEVPNGVKLYMKLMVINP